MSVQADRWIKRMSMRPTFVVLQHDGKEVLSHESAEVLQMELNNEKIKGFAGAEAADLLKHNWQPMISPFEPKNQREIERNGTEEEALLLKHMGPEYLKKKIGNSLKSFRIDPLLGLQIRQRILSYGTSSFGYDVTLGDDFRIFTNVNTGTIDPLDFDEEACLTPFKGDVCIIPPNSYILGVTREYFRIPRDVMVACVGKSTYARCGAIVNVTPIEPGFEGNVVIEISNATNSPLKVYANQGVAQFMFFRGDEECEVSYADKGGKYQGQTGMTLAKV